MRVRLPPSVYAAKQIPDLYLAGLEIIKKAFEEKDWHSFIENNRSILDEIAENELI